MAVNRWNFLTAVHTGMILKRKGRRWQQELVGKATRAKAGSVDAVDDEALARVP